MLQRVLVCLMLLAGLLLPAAFSAQAEQREAAESVVKAAFLYNFTKFVEWPAAAFAADQGSLAICILGEDPFGKAMDAVRRKKVGARIVAVRQAAGVDEAEGCQVLFVSASERNRLEQILHTVKARPVLTVSDMNKFAQAGGMINFIMQEDKVRFAINAGAARKAGLKIGSQLLSLAVTVIEDPTAP